MIQAFADALAECPLDLIGAEEKEKKIKDEDGNLTGEIEKSCAYEVEIPKGNGSLSRLQFSVKILEDKLRIEPSEIDENDFQIEFVGLEISYIDSHKNLYFRAQDLRIFKEGK